MHKGMNRSGQSLVEILIAVAIGGFIIGSAMVAINLALKSGSKVQTIGSSTQFLTTLTDSAKSSAEGNWNSIYGLDKTGCPGACPKYYFVRDTALTTTLGTEGVLGEDVLAGLLGYWKFDETGVTAPPNIAYDASPNNNKGTLTSSPVIAAAGQAGSAYRFTTDGQRVITPSIAPSGLNNHTIAVWVKVEDLTAPGSGNAKGIIMKGNTALSYGIDISGTTIPAIRYGIRDDAVHIPSVSYNINGWSTTAWHHLVGVYKVDDKVELYIDGVSVGSTVIGTFNKAAVTSGDLEIGASGRVISGNAAVPRFRGMIDEARIYNRALSAVEVKQLYGSKIYNRYFSVQNVNRDSCGRGNVTAAAATTCLNGSEVVEDPSTQKLVASVAPKDTGVAVTATEYLVRSKNSADASTDWSGVVDGSGVYTVPTPNFSGKNSINTDVQGQISL